MHHSHVESVCKCPSVHYILTSTLCVRGRYDGWDLPGFDDSEWPTGADGGPNGVSPWGKRPQVCLPACLSACVSVCLSVCVSAGL
eukprot:COSAG03_NODE_19712_length_331_cov_1.000000_1_plen_84_part_10